MTFLDFLKLFEEFNQRSSLTHPDGFHILLYSDGSGGIEGDSDDRVFSWNNPWEMEAILKHGSAERAIVLGWKPE